MCEGGGRVEGRGGSDILVRRKREKASFPRTQAMEKKTYIGSCAWRLT